MEIWQAIILGLIQGLTELLPVSSSAHLLIVPRMLGWRSFGLAFDVALHAGTTLAIIWYFHRELAAAAASLGRWGSRLLSSMRDGTLAGILKPGRESGSTDSTATANPEFLGLAIICSCIPAGLAGLFLKEQIEEVFRSPVLCGINLALFGMLLYAADRRARAERNLSTLRLSDAWLIGLMQAMALMPGVSRSGITITGGLWRGFSRSEAARFSFLMISPLVAAATGLEFRELIRTLNQTDGWPHFWEHDCYLFLAGSITAFLSGLLSIHFLLAFLKKFRLWSFAVYRLLTGAWIVYYFTVISRSA